MKKNITFTKLRNFIVILGVSIIIPFPYVLSQGTQPEIKVNELTNISSISSTTKEESLIIFSSNTVSTTSSEKGFVEKGEIMTAIKFIPIERVRIGIVQNFNSENNSFVVKVGSSTLMVTNTATTSILFGDSDVATVGDIKYGTKIYAFGYISNNNAILSASKIVIANKSVLSRKSE